MLQFIKKEPNQYKSVRYLLDNHRHSYKLYLASYFQTSDMLLKLIML